MRLRLLALHGRYQTAKMCMEKLSGLKPTRAAPVARLSQEHSGEDGLGHALRREVTAELETQRVRVLLERCEPAVELPRLELEFQAMDAPHVVQPEVKLRGNASLQVKAAKKGCETRAWWFNDGSDELAGIDASVAAVQERLRDDGPFDGLIGFSQGASLASLLCSEGHASQLKLRYAVLCSAYVFPGGRSFGPDTPHSIHVFSDLDRMVRADRSEALAERMGGLAVKHEAGHHVPLPWLHTLIYSDVAHRPPPPPPPPPSGPSNS